MSDIGGKKSTFMLHPRRNILKVETYIFKSLSNFYTVIYIQKVVYMNSIMFANIGNAKQLL